VQDGIGEFMELGDTGWYPMSDGTYVNHKEGKVRDENGNIYSLDGIELNDTDLDSLEED